MRSKRPFLLFEILIGLTLLGILLWALFSFLRSSAKMDQGIEKMTHSLLRRQFLMERLQTLFSSMVLVESDKAKTLFYTQKFDKKKPSRLIVHFDHGIDPDPLFSGPCIAAISLNDTNQLQLTIWPEERDKDKTTVREEILLDHVDKFVFRWPKKEKNGPFSWQEERSKEDGTFLPSFICLDVWTNGKKSPLSFAFLILSEDPEICYSSGETKI